MPVVNWGDIPSWVGAFLTSGSLALAFFILLRDRRSGEQSQVERIGVWVTAPAPKPIHLHTKPLADADAKLPAECTLTVFARNESTLPATIILALVSFAYLPKIIHGELGDVPGEMKEGSELVTIGMVPPGETKIEYRLELPAVTQVMSILKVDYRIRDNAGRHWDSSGAGLVRVSSSTAKLAWGHSTSKSTAFVKLKGLPKAFLPRKRTPEAKESVLYMST